MIANSLTNWHFADVWEAIAECQPSAPALIQGTRRLSWGEFEGRAECVARQLLSSGLSPHAKVAQYLYNLPEYLESVFAAFKAGMSPVNTNFRYTGGELEYLWENADVEVVIFASSFADVIERVRATSVRHWWWVDDGSGGRSCPSWATPYEEVVTLGRQSGISSLRDDRTGDDIIFIYTGGTTGHPKGVMWRQDDLFAALNETATLRFSESGGLVGVRASISAPIRHPRPRLVPCAPLMHGTGLLTAFTALNAGGAVALLEGHGFSAEEFLDLVDREKVTECSIVGDVFAKPILYALDAERNRWNLDSLWLVVSSGVAWSAETKSRLKAHLPKIRLVDSLGSSEAVGLGRSAMKNPGQAEGGFTLGSSAQVLADDGQPVPPGSGRSGLLALKGRIPIGYYKDQAKTEATFRVVDGERWVIPGDWAEVEADGSIRLLGRGSGCINTGGEKVFPEEVEEVLKKIPSVVDAAVFGMPDQRFGECVIGLVEVSGPFDETKSIATVKTELASFKAPKRIIAVPAIERMPSGKLDYVKLRELAAQVLDR